MPGGRLYILAMDHRGSFVKDLFGFTGDLSAADRARISGAKRVIYDGFLDALRAGAPQLCAGLLVDEEYGAAIARDAHHRGIAVAMPVEKSGQAEFDFDYGSEYRDHVQAFDPDYVKVLVRYNPDGDRKMNARQAARLRELSGWLQRSGRRLLLELLVPPTDAELKAAGSIDVYDHAVRPALVVRAIAELQAAGVEPSVWKIEGIDDRAGCQHVATQARSAGRWGVRCIVLGRGANERKVEHWLRQGAGVDGYAGFAIGRTIWFDALKAMLAGTIDREAAAAQVTKRYVRAVEVYDEAASTAGAAA